MLTKLCRSWFFPFKFAFLVITRNNRNMLCASNKGQTNSPVFFSKSKYSSIIISRSWLKFFNWLVLLFSNFSISTNPRASPNSQISRQSVFLPDGLINLGLNRGFTSYSRLNVLIGIVASISKRLQCRFNLLNLIFRRVELANYCQNLFHVHYFITCEDHGAIN